VLGLAALCGVGGPVRAMPRTALAASWQAGPDYRVGVLQVDPGRALRVANELDVPGRAHGLLVEPAGTLLTVARRPGDWLLRWDRTGRTIAWRWIEPGRAFTGHVLNSFDGATVFTTELDLETGAGLVGVREAGSLRKRDEWPTHGIDPHELIQDPADGNRLFVANGGVQTRPESGRVKRDLARMDSSLAWLDARSGELLGQWRLEDRRLSLRHLAWNRADGRTVMGIALQAEHDDPATRDSSPVLALFDGATLRVAPAGTALAGYGGDIAACGGGFAVSCPRAQCVTVHDANGTWRGLVPLAEACPLAATSGRVWAGGRGAAETWSAGKDSQPEEKSAHPLPDIRLDNHWIGI